MPSLLTAKDTCLYLYAIVSDAPDARMPADGIDGAEIGTIAESGVAAIVSRVPKGAIRPQRSKLAAHHRVLRDLAETHAVLPVAFGTVVEDEDDLREVLQLNRVELAASLARLQGKVEMGLKVYWDSPNIFEYFVATHRELEDLRNRLFRPGHDCTTDEKVALGELFASLLRQSRRRHTERVVQALAPRSVAVRTIDPGEERLVMKLACLVERQAQDSWEEAVRQTASLFDDNYRFNYSGPWAPYNFVDVDLKLT